MTLALDLEHREVTHAYTASSGAEPHRGFAVDMAIILLPAKDNQFHATGAPLFRPAISAFESELFLRQGIHALIGQDVLERCVLTQHGPERWFKLSWTD